MGAKTAEVGAIGRADTSTAEERWAAWRARGAEYDRKTNQRAVAVTALLGGGLALWLTVALLFGQRL